MRNLIAATFTNSSVYRGFQALFTSSSAHNILHFLNTDKWNKNSISDLVKELIVKRQQKVGTTDSRFYIHQMSRKCYKSKNVRVTSIRGINGQEICSYIPCQQNYLMWLFLYSTWDNKMFLSYYVLNLSRRIKFRQPMHFTSF